MNEMSIKELKEMSDKFSHDYYGDKISDEDLNKFKNEVKKFYSDVENLKDKLQNILSDTEDLLSDIK